MVKQKVMSSKWFCKMKTGYSTMNLNQFLRMLKVVEYGHFLEEDWRSHGHPIPNSY